MIQGADANARAFDDSTVLMLAAENGHTETVAELLDRGADIYAIASDGYTALMRAAKNGQTEIVLTLLPHDRIAREIDANAALMFAAGYGHIETVDELLDQGADVNAKTSDGRYTALMFAAKNGHTEIVLDLLSRDNLDWKIALDQFGHLLALPNLNKEVSFLLAVIIHDEELRNSIITKFNQENTDNPINKENNDILGVGPEAYKTLKDLESWYKGYLTDPDSGLSLSEHKAENLANQRFFKLFNDQGFRREVLARNDLVKDLLSKSASLPTDFAGLRGGQNYLDAARRLEPEDLYKLTSKIIDNSKAANGGTATSQALSLVVALRKDRADQTSASPATTINRGSTVSIAEPIVTTQKEGGCVVS